MTGQGVMFKLYSWIRRAVLLTVWILCFVSLIIVTGNNELSELYNEAANPGTELMPPKNQTGAVSYWRRDPNADGRLIHSVDLKNLRVENNNLGVFKTALHTVIKIDDLQLELYRYSFPEVIGNRSPDNPGAPEDVMADAQALVKQVSHRLTNMTHGWRVNSIDLGNVSEVRVDNFDYKVFHDGDLFFAVQSRRAMVSYKWPGIVLRGRVTLETADGSTLKSNHIKWEVEKQLFIVRGVYALDRGGVRTTGKDICVDAQLNGVKAQNAKVKEKEDKECFARL